MKESKLIFTNKYSDSSLIPFHEYKFNPMTRFVYFTGNVIEIRRDEKY